MVKCESIGGKTKKLQAPYIALKLLVSPFYRTTSYLGGWTGNVADMDDVTIAVKRRSLTRCTHVYKGLANFNSLIVKPCGGAHLGLDETFSHEHILANEDQVRHHNRHRAEKRLQSYMGGSMLKICQLAEFAF